MFAHHVGHFGDSAVLQHGVCKADGVLRNDAAFTCQSLHPGFNVGLRRREERVDYTRAKGRVRQGESAKEKRHKLGEEA